MSPFDRVIIATIYDVTRRAHGPARTLAVAAHLGLKDRVTRHHLAKLEKRGYVARPEGAKSGWTATKLGRWMANSQPGSLQGIVAAVAG